MAADSQWSGSNPHFTSPLDRIEITDAVITVDGCHQYRRSPALPRPPPGPAATDDHELLINPAGTLRYQPR
jgi:hypothetical protein